MVWKRTKEGNRHERKVKKMKGERTEVVTELLKEG